MTVQASDRTVVCRCCGRQLAETDSVLCWDETRNRTLGPFHKHCYPDLTTPEKRASAPLDWVDEPEKKPEPPCDPFAARPLGLKQRSPEAKRAYRQGFLAALDYAIACCAVGQPTEDTMLGMEIFREAFVDMDKLSHLEKPSSGSS